MNFAELAWLNSWGASRYDPDLKKVILVGDPPEYVVAHEEAHARQHSEGTLLYALWLALWWMPFVATLLLIPLERDADRQAREEMQRRGLWNARNQKAARLWRESYQLGSYTP